MAHITVEDGSRKWLATVHVDGGEFDIHLGARPTQVRGCTPAKPTEVTVTWCSNGWYGPTFDDAFDAGLLRWGPVIPNTDGDCQLLIDLAHVVQETGVPV